MKKIIICSVLILVMTFSVVPSVFAKPYLKVDFVSDRAVDITVKNTSDNAYKLASWQFENGILYVNCTESSDGSSNVESQRIVSPEAIFPAPVILTDSLNRFSDIDKYKTEILMLNSRGIINGYPDGTFAGDRSVKRAEISVMLFAAGNYELSDKVNVFPDTSGHWSEKYVNSLNNKGVINGYSDGTFKPEGQVKMSELLTLINSMFDFYEDSSVRIPSIAEHWSKSSFDNLVKKGIILPEDEIYKSYQPDKKASRYEVVLLLARALNSNGRIR